MFIPCYLIALPSPSARQTRAVFSNQHLLFFVHSSSLLFLLETRLRRKAGNAQYHLSATRTPFHDDLLRYPATPITRATTRAPASTQMSRTVSAKRMRSAGVDDGILSTLYPLSSRIAIPLRSYCGCRSVCSSLTAWPQLATANRDVTDRERGGGSRTRQVCRAMPVVIRIRKT